MKKFGLTMLTLLCALSVAFGLSSAFGRKSVHATGDPVPGVTPTLSNMMYNVSTSKDGILLATAIKNYGDVYEIGYYITVSTGDVVTLNAPTDIFYTAILSGGNRWTAQTLFGDDFEDAGIIVWEIEYNPAYTYTFNAYARVGQYVDDKFVESETEVKAAESAKSFKGENTVTITVNGAGYGTVDETSIGSVPYGTPITSDDNELTVGGTTVTATATTDTAQYNYTFDGWTIPSAKVKGDVTVTANFSRTLRKYDLSFVDGGSQGDLSLDYGTNVKDALDGLDTPIKTGYTFSKWQLYDGESYADLEGDETIGGAATVKAIWTANEYTLSFSDSQGAHDAVTVTYDQAIGTLDTLSRAGYSAAWKIDDVEITASTVWNYDDDKTAVATYTANTNTPYTVKFFINTIDAPAVFTEQTAKQINATGTTDETATYDGNVGAIFRAYKIDEDNVNNVLSGTIAGDGSLVLKVYCEVDLVEVSTYAEFAAAVAEDNNYISLTADLTYDKTVAALFDTFSGIIDGNGYTIIDIKLGNNYSNTAWTLFTAFDGEMKNICFDVKYYGDFGGDYSAGSIARTFNGKAENVLLKSLMVDYYYRNQWVSRVGIMFGQLGANAEVRNSIIQCVLYNGNYPCPTGNSKPAGWIAASANAAATVENVHVIDVANKNLPWVGNNGIAKSSTCVVGDAEAVSEAAQGVFDEDIWYVNGVTAPVMLNASNRATYTRTRVEVSTFAEMVTAIRANNNAYIALTSDITYDNSLITGSNKDSSGNAVISTNFSGVIDGQGHKFNSVALNASNGSDLRLFRWFTGDIKNIEIVGSLHNGGGQTSAAGIIALEFSGVAQNIKLTLRVSQLYMKNNADTQQSGGLFGRLANGAFIKNVLIDFEPAAGDGNVSGFGFVAGFVKENAAVSVKNVVVINRGDTVRPIIALAYSTSSINGTKPAATTRYHASDANANTMNGTIITNALVGDEATVIAGAGSILGSAWTCDGVNIPSLK